MPVRRNVKILIGGALGVAAVAVLAQPGLRGPAPTGPVDAASCAECHVEVTRTDYLHGPVSVGACAACHRVDSVEDHTYSLVREGADLCTYCHDMDFGSGAVVHAPLTEGDCTACHDPHGGSDIRFLKAPSVDELCASCHDDVGGGKRHVHGPVAVGACSVCHDPHASRHPVVFQFSAELQADARSEDASMVDGLSPAGQPHIWHSRLA